MERRRLIVEVRTGPLLGAKAIILPGEALRIGRTERAHLVVPRDGAMSGLHCEIRWDGEVCRVRDEKSARGTMLGGEPIPGEAVAPHGSWIVAGETSFMLYVEAFTPPRAPPLDPAAAAQAEAALTALHGLGGRMYGVLDAARDERVLQLLREAVDDHRSLYEGVKGEALADVAPHLVSFRRDSGLLERVVKEGWTRSFGVFVKTNLAFAALRRHFRRFLMVEEDETRQKLYFRFYDPRVLREFMPLATVRQRDDIFEGVEVFAMEGEAGELVRFERTAERR